MSKLVMTCAYREWHQSIKNMSSKPFISDTSSNRAQVKQSCYGSKNKAKTTLKFKQNKNLDCALEFKTFD